MQYRLKPGQESIRIVSGPFAGRRYVRGRLYAEIPPQEAGRFEEIRPTAPKRSPKKNAPAETAPAAEI